MEAVAKMSRSDGLWTVLLRLLKLDSRTYSSSAASMLSSLFLLMRLLMLAMGRGNGGAAEAARMSRSGVLCLILKVRLSLLMLVRRSSAV